MLGKSIILSVFEKISSVPEAQNIHNSRRSLKTQEMSEERYYFEMISSIPWILSVTTNSDIRKLGQGKVSNFPNI